MPRTGLQTGPSLAIELESWQVYSPGDVIIGKIARTQDLVSPEAQVTLRLRGRAKSKMIVKGSNAKSIYRGRFNLFAPNDSSWVIYSGPLHIAPQTAGGSWPFAVTVPTRGHASALAGNDEKCSFLPLQKDKVDAQPLPDVFYYKGQNFWSSTTFFGYVEYYLEAELVATTHGKRTTTTATLPLFIQTPSMEEPLTEKQFALQQYSSAVSARSYHLVPDLQVEKLSLAQKARAAFGSSKVPQLEFAVQVGYPTKIQLGTPIPLSLRVVPDLEKSSEALQSAPIVYRLKWFNLTLKSTTKVICSGTLYSHDQSRNEENSFGLNTLVSRLAHPVIIPAGRDAEPLDIGTMLQLLLEETQASALGNPESPVFDKRVYPSFKTYNIEHTHRLKWDAGLQISGLDDVKLICGEGPVTVLAPSARQMKEAMANLEEGDMKKKYEAWLTGAELGFAGIELAVEIAQAIMGS